ncbi:Molybdopterin synthase catalytic subunit, partial [Armadillidium nasatum]
LGLVNIKEASVIIAVSSEHRQESLEAVSFLIEKLKASVPIWKKEIYSDQQSEWKQNKECNWKNNKPSSCEQENYTDHIEEEKSVEENLEFNEEETILPIPPIKEGRLNCEEHNRSFRNEKLDRNFVQIVVPRHEIERRINSFIERKRSEANSLNNELFLMNNINKDNCARTAAHFNRSDGSKSHVPVVNVSNEYGPQTLNTCIGFSTQFSDTSPKKGIEERLVNLEEHLNIRDEEVSESSIFSRINEIEKRVLFLEGLSPEYFKNINFRYNPKG